MNWLFDNFVYILYIKHNVKLKNHKFMNELVNCNICHHFGVEMHTDTVTKWQFNGVEEDAIKNDTYYKVWLVVEEKTDPRQPQPYTCEVYWFEEVPKEIIEAEELSRNYWATKEPKKWIRGSVFKHSFFSIDFISSYNIIQHIILIIKTWNGYT